MLSNLYCIKTTKRDDERTNLPFKPVNKKMMIMIGHGSYLTHQMCKYHVRWNAAKLWILNTNMCTL